ncbi:hypothetical protein ACFWP7_20830 [Streptomyces sp. NPDC058470]
MSRPHQQRGKGDGGLVGANAAHMKVEDFGPARLKARSTYDCS